jgi:hypothetical protein
VILIAGHTHRPIFPGARPEPLQVGGRPHRWADARSWLAHHETNRELLTRSILVSAFALWGLVCP